MKIISLLLIAFITWLDCSQAHIANMVCFYDATNAQKDSMALSDLEPALHYCNYLVYGYAKIEPANVLQEPSKVLVDASTGRDHYRTITNLKSKYPNIRILLSVGGDKDIDLNYLETNKYLQILEDGNNRQAFVDSAVQLLRTYGFDGLDLSWQFPKNHPRKVVSGFKKVWSTVKGWFTSTKKVDEKAEEHKTQFTQLTHALRSAFNLHGYLLTLTMLPNVDPELFIDIPSVIEYVNFVNLCTFDFQTPERDPKIADYSAPLYEMYERDPTHNIEYNVQFWLNRTTQAHKINVGISTFGRAWMMSKDSGITGYPPIDDTSGAAPLKNSTANLGLLSWPQICTLIHADKDLTGEKAPLKKVGDPTKRFGTYAYRSADDNGNYGIWVSYEEPATAAIKAGYVHARELGGVALFDLTRDDYRGECAGERYPILRSIKYKL
ncbi:chitinase-like protein Idgf5 [Teleopsis dalmanni]|uniref:chitinase-like protein Idgf5 n=2 Tax=Teleopsis dalmanni TaxID=139649 RepID=UPI000D32A6F9|nr:chitinase-like protein Idgf5 [Teleopsis dalmanni]XP_037956123.1 chitinase-like protein Idgf5 [Teleopsis dalmanni]